MAMATRSTAMRAMRPKVRRASMAKGAVKGVRTIARASRKAGVAQGRMEERSRGRGRSSRRGRMAVFIAGSGAGAAAEYLLDPQDGKRRRHMLRDRTMAKLRRGSREAERKGRYMAGKAQGVVAEAATTPGRDPSGLSDPALEAKVESELFRPPGVGRESINVQVENGRVQLRGELKKPEQIEELIERVHAIDGVSQVDNLLHLADEPAPHA